jgi:hypothetical protein
MRASVHLPFLNEKNAHRSVRTAPIHHYADRCIWMLAVALVIVPSLMGLIWAADGTDAGSTGKIDPRWQPWIGSWRLVADIVGENDGNIKGKYLLDIRPGADGKSIIMKSSQDGEVLFEDEIAVDGSRQPLEDTECTGWHKYSWSDTGKRLLFESESSCVGEPLRRISGISIIADNRDWVDIQLLRSGEERIVSIRRYEPVAGDPGDAKTAGARAFGADRFPPVTRFSIEEIIELNRKVAPEVLEAALVEVHKPFKIDSRTIERLADAGVSPQLIDLMVALSYPDKFTVERHGITPVQRPPMPPGPVVGPPVIWLGWHVWPGWYPSWRHHHDGGWSGGGRISGGRLINGRGYSRVSPRGRSGRSFFRLPSGFPLGNRGGGRGSASKDDSEKSKDGSATASPSGYHSGDRESGKAKPR